MAHMVFCVKLKKEVPGLDERPFDNDLGQKVYDNVSQQAWGMWTEHCKMLLNEYRLNPARREDQERIIRTQTILVHRYRPRARARRRVIHTSTHKKPSTPSSKSHQRS